jgi:hypothetical protein
MEIYRIDAIRELVGGHISGDGDAINVNYIDNQTPPSDSAIETKLAEMIAEYDAQEYARKRQAEYPTIAELTVALYDTDDKSAVEAKRAAVKAKYPKPE